MISLIFSKKMGPFLFSPSIGEAARFSLGIGPSPTLRTPSLITGLELGREAAAVVCIIFKENNLTYVFKVVIFKLMKLTKRQEEHLSKTLLDLSKICVATLIIGPFISGFKIGLLVAGLISFLALLFAGLIIDKGE